LDIDGTLVRDHRTGGSASENGRTDVRRSRLIGLCFLLIGLGLITSGHAGIWITGSASRLKVGKGFLMFRRHRASGQRYHGNEAYNDLLHGNFPFLRILIAVKLGEEASGHVQPCVNCARNPSPILEYERTVATHDMMIGIKSDRAKMIYVDGTGVEISGCLKTIKVVDKSSSDFLVTTMVVRRVFGGQLSRRPIFFLDRCLTFLSVIGRLQFSLLSRSDHRCFLSALFGLRLRPSLLSPPLRLCPLPFDQTLLLLCGLTSARYDCFSRSFALVT
jgi:hypothetical protein